MRRLFARAQPPTGVLVTDLDVAIGLYTTLALLGLRIPRDVSAVACGYWPLLDCLRPQPTCYKVSYETLASRLDRWPFHASNDFDAAVREESEEKRRKRA